MKSFADYQAHVQELAKPEPIDPHIAEEERRKAAENLGAEMWHIEMHLRQHGLGIAQLLRDVAKFKHGIDIPHIPPLVPSSSTEVALKN